MGPSRRYRLRPNRSIANLLQIRLPPAAEKAGNMLQYPDWQPVSDHVGNANRSTLAMLQNLTRHTEGPV